MRTCSTLKQLYFGLLIFIGSLSLSVWGEQSFAGEGDVYPWELNLISDGFEKVSAPGASPPCATDASPRPSCTNMADQFCAQLWSPKNKGNLDTLSGKVRLGKSEKSDMTQARKVDLEALVDALPRLPEDLQSKVSPLLSKLKVLLSQEQDSEAWYNAVNEVENGFWELARSVSNQRVIQLHPNWARLEKSRLTIEQRAAFETSFWDVKNQVTAAKYENHPNWLRVTKLYKQVKEDLLDEIPKWNLPSKLKKNLLARVREVSLKMPSADPRISDNESEAEIANCATTRVDAFHAQRHRTFTVCAGEFNSFQSDASLYATMAHEVGHSIASDSVIFDQFMATPFGKVLDQLCNAKGPVFSCSKWNQLKRTVLVEPRKILELKPPLEKLTSCLVPEAGLKAFDDDAIREVAREVTMDDMSEIKSNLGFSNPLRPDRSRAVSEGFVFLHRFCDPDQPFYFELIAQELHCNGYSSNVANRSKNIERAFKTAESIGVALNERLYSFCGRDCKDLAEVKMGRATVEETADWIARKLMTTFIKREASVASRRDALLTGYADFCPHADEKQEENDDHPPDRSRLISVFSPEVRQLVECEPDVEVEKSSAKCDL
jgi:hypothetical protein